MDYELVPSVSLAMQGPVEVCLHCVCDGCASTNGLIAYVLFRDCFSVAEADSN